MHNLKVRIKRIIKGRVPLSLRRYFNRNKRPLKVFWWRYDYPNKLNFGDEITKYIIESLFGRRCEWANPAECELVGAGSVIEMLQGRSNRNKIDVWGSGFMREGPANTLKNLRFFAVRGPNSSNRVVSVQGKIALGDPGILSNLVFQPSTKVSYKVGIIPHYVDAEHPEVKKYKNNPLYKIINPLSSPAEVAREITSCEIVFSSSLHGLIVADSFNVPNYWMPLSDNVTGGSYKFNDYYLSTGRSLTKKDPNILGNDKAIARAIETYQPVVKLKKMQQDLIRSFPY